LETQNKTKKKRETIPKTHSRHAQQQYNQPKSVSDRNRNILSASTNNQRFFQPSLNMPENSVAGVKTILMLASFVPK
jgi:hypothetical protein